MKHGITARILISLLGAAFIVWGAGLIALGTVGERTNAVITAVRREGGERNNGKSGQYLYNIGYTFTLPDGRKINGISKKPATGSMSKPTAARQGACGTFLPSRILTRWRRKQALAPGRLA
jgi:hypothetical protein